MKRLQVHVSVEDLAASVRFYSTLFDAAPSVAEDDYAKWMLDEPGVNFAISARGNRPGLNHLGFQVEDDELHAISDRLAAAGNSVVEQTDAACCYAVSDKTWVTDPSGIAWETFHSHGQIAVFGADTAPAPAPASAATKGCCD